MRHERWRLPAAKFAKLRAWIRTRYFRTWNRRSVGAVDFVAASFSWAPLTCVAPPGPKDSRPGKANLPIGDPRHSSLATHHSSLKSLITPQHLNPVPIPRPFKHHRT